MALVIFHLTVGVALHACMVGSRLLTGLDAGVIRWSPGRKTKTPELVFQVDAHHPHHPRQPLPHEIVGQRLTVQGAGVRGNVMWITASRDNRDTTFFHLDLGRLPTDGEMSVDVSSFRFPFPLPSFPFSFPFGVFG